MKILALSIFIVIFQSCIVNTLLINRQFLPILPLIPLKNQNCVTLSGAEGKCGKLTQCFPFLNEPEDNKDETNGLAILLTEKYGFCEQKQILGYSQQGIQKQEIFVDIFDSLVCCPKAKPKSLIPSFVRPRPPSVSQNNKNSTKKECGLKRMDGMCGKRQIEIVKDDSNRIVSGEKAMHGQYPWAVALIDNRRQICGGSIIDERHILTAAHCVSPIPRNQISRLKVLIGDHDIYKVEPHEVVRHVQKAFIHTGFNFEDLKHDIAVLRLDKPIEFGKFIQPICVSKKTPDGIKKTFASVAGWGRIYDMGPQSRELRFALVQIWQNLQCQIKYNSVSGAPKIDSSMICAGTPPKDSCQGDSGGPLMLKNGENFDQVGIVSWGAGCGKLPGVYTRPDHYLDWLDEHICME